MREKVVVNDPKGVGAFLQASNEIEMIPTLQMGGGKTVLLDYFFNHEVKKDVTGAVAQHHYVWDQQDLNGYSLFGFVWNKHGVRTKSLEAAPTAANLKGADFYVIVDPDTEKETATPNYIQAQHIDAIYNWVNSGGVLLLFGNDTGNVELDHFNQLVKRFGIQFNKDSRNKVTGSQFAMGTFAVPENHSIFKTAKKIYIKEYASQTITKPAQAVFTDGDVVVMSVAKVGKGTVFVVGDPWFYNEYFDGRKLPAELENYKAGNDLIKWALKQSPPKSKNQIVIR
jgi:unsaturated rhamnogalacturonyl hydrolase